MHCVLSRLASAVHRLASRAAVLPVGYCLGSGQVLRCVDQPPNLALHTDTYGLRPSVPVNSTLGVMWRSGTSMRAPIAARRRSKTCARQVLGQQAQSAHQPTRRLASSRSPRTRWRVGSAARTEAPAWRAACSSVASTVVSWLSSLRSFVHQPPNWSLKPSRHGVPRRPA